MCACAPAPAPSPASRASTTAPDAAAPATKPGRRSCRALAAQRTAEEIVDAGPDAIAAAHAAYAAIDAGTYDAGPPMVSDADQVIAALRPKFRACYSEGLQRDPKMEGCTVVRARVASDGAVSFSEVFVYDGLSREVAECIAAAVAAARFSAPGVDGTRLMVPVTFVQPR